MKFAVLTICLAAFAAVSYAAPQKIDFGGLQGTIDATHVVNGVEEGNGQIDPKLTAKAEEIIKSMIHKHLNKKKQNKKAAKGKKAKTVVEETLKEKALTVEKVQEAPEKVSEKVLPSKIQWDEHQEARNQINERVPGGTDAVDALLQLVRERQN